MGAVGRPARMTGHLEPQAAISASPGSGTKPA